MNATRIRLRKLKLHNTFSVFSLSFEHAKMLDWVLLGKAKRQNSTE
jgi:hypothetical protein